MEVKITWVLAGTAIGYHSSFHVPRVGDVVEIGSAEPYPRFRVTGVLWKKSFVEKPSLDVEVEELSPARRVTKMVAQAKSNRRNK